MLAIDNYSRSVNDYPKCPICECVNTYQMGSLMVCPECAHEWVPRETIEMVSSEDVIRDAVGNVLNDGDTVTIRAEPAAPAEPEVDSDGNGI